VQTAFSERVKGRLWNERGIEEEVQLVIGCKGHRVEVLVDQSDATKESDRAKVKKALFLKGWLPADRYRAISASDK
jgi:hypothetical protein